MEKYPKLASWASDSGSLGNQHGYERDTNNCAELQPAAHSGQPLLSPEIWEQKMSLSAIAPPS
jgi:hypothetical protein